MLGLCARVAAGCLYLSSYAIAQTSTVSLVINTVGVNAVNFTITGPGVTSLHTSGASGRVTINPEVVPGGGTISIVTSSNPGIQPTEILFDYSETGVITNVRILRDGLAKSLNSSLYHIIGNELIFTKRASIPSNGLDLRTNLIDGLLFDRSTMPFFIINGAEMFPGHELKVYQLGETGNQDHSVFSEYVLANNPATNNRLVYSSLTEFRWNGCESTGSDNKSFTHAPAGTYLFELTLHDDAGVSSTFYGQMFVMGLYRN